MVEILLSIFSASAIVTSISVLLNKVWYSRREAKELEHVNVEGLHDKVTTFASETGRSSASRDEAVKSLLDALLKLKGAGGKVDELERSKKESAGLNIGTNLERDAKP